MDHSTRNRQLFLADLLRVLGLTAACAPIAFASACSAGPDTSSASSDNSGGSGSGTTASSSSSSSSSGSGGAGGAGGESASSSGSGGGGGAGGGGQAAKTVCYDKLEPNSMCPSIGQASMQWLCTPDYTGQIIEWQKGPAEVNGKCCYQVTTQPGCPVVGRPFIVNGAAIVAALANTALPAGDLPASPCGMDKTLLTTLAGAWAKDGLYEHASVASFARLSLELMAAGAPAELVELAHRAALDEVKHAELCFSLASGYLGERVGPGRLPIGSSVEIRSDLCDLAEGAAREGCIGETLSALEARERLDIATDPDARAALLVIAADEARHAELAWRIVAWAIEAGGDAVRARVQRVFAQAASLKPQVCGTDDPRAVAFGRLDGQHIARIHEAGLAMSSCPAPARSSRPRRTRIRPLPSSVDAPRPICTIGPHGGGKAWHEAISPQR